MLALIKFSGIQIMLKMNYLMPYHPLFFRWGTHLNRYLFLLVSPDFSDDLVPHLLCICAIFLYKASPSECLTLKSEIQIWLWSRSFTLLGLKLKWKFRFQVWRKNLELKLNLKIAFPVDVWVHVWSWQLNSKLEVEVWSLIFKFEAEV